MATHGKKQYSKEQWLEKALKQLAKKGNLGLTIDELSKAIGVTKGSFYWHFRSRYDFILNLFDYWAEMSTTRVIAHVNKVQGSPSEQLHALTRFLVQKDICRYELAIRAWVQIHPILIPMLKQIDLRRYEFVAGLFREIGFRGDELEMRVRTFLVFYSMESSFYPIQKLDDRLLFLEMRHACLTRFEQEKQQP